jgi:hypothetical protein
VSRPARGDVDESAASGSTSSTKAAVMMDDDPALIDRLVADFISIGCL